MEPAFQREKKRFNLISKDKLKSKPWKWKPCNPTETEEGFFIVIIFIFNVVHFEEKTLSVHPADVREGESVWKV